MDLNTTQANLTPTSKPVNSGVMQENLLIVEHTSNYQNSDSNNSIRILAEAIAGIASQQGPWAAGMLKPLSKDIPLFDSKSDEIEFCGDVLHTMLGRQP